MSRLYRPAALMGLRLAMGDMPSGESLLADINAMPGVLKPLTAEDVTIRGAMLVNDAPLKDGKRRLTVSLLDEMAKAAPGVKVLRDHAGARRPFTEVIPVGRTIRADLVQDASGVNWLRAYYYMANGDESEELANKVDAGVIDQCSVGFYAKDLTCSVCGADAGECDHVPGATYEGATCLWEYSNLAEFEEWSFVDEGMADGTHFFLAASARGIDVMRDDELEAWHTERLRAERDEWAQMSSSGWDWLEGA
jgi:hypothetical protein